MRNPPYYPRVNGRHLAGKFARVFSRFTIKIHSCITVRFGMQAMQRTATPAGVDFLVVNKMYGVLRRCLLPLAHPRTSCMLLIQPQNHEITPGQQHRCTGL
jgi:hypothetical protein